jgi:hypothetical protein
MRWWGLLRPLSPQAAQKLLLAMTEVVIAQR